MKSLYRSALLLFMSTPSLSLAVNLGNSAYGTGALANNVSGSENTAMGYGALLSNNADANTAVGYYSLFSNTIGFENTAVGAYSLISFL